MGKKSTVRPTEDIATIRGNITIITDRRRDNVRKLLNLVELKIGNDR